MNAESKSKIKWIVGLVLAILTAVATYIGAGCTSIKNLELRGNSSVDGQTGVIVQYDTALNRQVIRSVKNDVEQIGRAHV